MTYVPGRKQYSTWNEPDSSAAETVSPSNCVAVEVPKAPFSRKQQQTRFDGGVEEDGTTLRPLLEVTEPEPFGHLPRAIIGKGRAATPKAGLRGSTSHRVPSKHVPRAGAELLCVKPSLGMSLKSQCLQF